MTFIAETSPSFTSAFVEEVVTILALFHGRLDFKKAWQERPR